MAQVLESNMVQFYRGSKDNLPADAKEVVLYMIPGESNIYVCFKDETPEKKNEMKNRGCIIGGDLNISLT